MKESEGDLDLYFHQSIPPLSEGNLVDLDLGVLVWFSSLFFLSSPPISISCFWWDLGVKDLTTSSGLAFLHRLHRFEFSTVIRGNRS